MKSARFLYALVAGLGLLTRAAWAADLVAPKPYDLYLKTDAEGTPLTVLHPDLAPVTPQVAGEMKAIQDLEAANKDWLVRIYAQRMEMRAAAHPADGIILQELGASRDLARLAGLNETDTDGGDTPEAAALRQPAPGPTGEAKPTTNPLARSYQYKSLIGGPMFGLHDYYGDAKTSPAEDSTADANGGKPVLRSAGAPTLRPSPNYDPSDIETPGMIAAKQAGATDLGSPDLTLDLLPGESMTQAEIEKAKAAALALPVPMTADQLHQLEGPTRSGVPSTNALAQPAVPVAQIAPEEDKPGVNAPIPVSKIPVLVPGHPPMRDPINIFRR